METIRKIFVNGVEWDFVTEILGRSIIMFILVLVVLRLSGKRGVRQLTLFEVAIILSLGSAAGDPMFQEEVPVVYAVIVLFVVILLYKLIAWASSEIPWFHSIMEGKPLVIVRDGQFEMNSRGKLNFSKREFLAELRNQSVEHLGQVRMGVLEVDGTLSLLFYEQAQVQAGLPLFPDQYVSVGEVESHVIYACMYCGNTSLLTYPRSPCFRCGKKEWALALSRSRPDEGV